jgi:UDP-N-acetylmuramoyl-L-alanyl-D-glutamate--2,6-diaminopimelate ligase
MARSGAPEHAALPTPTRAARPWADPYFTIGVTGTNGKTSTTLLIAHALRAGGQRVLTETTLGYALDDDVCAVPRTLAGHLAVFEQAAQQGCRHAAVEVTSEALARGFAKRWRFDLGVFTNLSQDHLEAHGSFEHYLASKAQLFVHLAAGRSAVLNACDDAALLLDQVTPGGVARVWYAACRKPALRAADLAAREVSITSTGTRVALEPSERAEALGGELHTRLIGAVFAENALAAAAAALEAGVPGAAARDGIAACPGVPGRFEVVARCPLVAVDYAHTPDALARTCETARELVGPGGRVGVVFGAGGDRDASKRTAMGRAVGERADFAIVTTDNPRHEAPAAIAAAVAAGCRKGGRAHVVLEPDRRRAIEQALNRARAADVVVVAGKGHETGQIVGDEVQPFSDVHVVRESVRERR